MTDMLGYKPAFDIAVENASEVDYKSLFPTFRDHPELFHFTMESKEHRRTDDEALRIAQAISPTIFEKVMGIGPSKSGGGPTILDRVESRHMLMVTYLRYKLESWGNVVEIGGGYGNFLRLATAVGEYDTWTVIDFQYLLDLQKWFLEAEHVVAPNVQFMPVDNINLTITPTVVIGTHSLSELSADDFTNYFEIIKKAKYLFYVSHNTSPSPALLAFKHNLIRTQFTLVDRVSYEGGWSRMYLYRNNND